jgi:hypothetical protein
MLKVTASCLLGLLAIATLAPAQTPPRMVRFTGAVRPVAGPLQPGLATLTFCIYADNEADGALWTETQAVVLDAEGRFTAVLGSTQPDGLPLELFAGGDARWLGVSGDGLAPQPRVMLLSVPYALKAADADTVGGKPLSAFVLAGDETGVGPDGLTYVDRRVLASGLAAGGPPSPLGGSGAAGPPSPLGGFGGAGGAGTPNYVGLFSDATTLVNSVMYQSGTSIGVNTTAPAAGFHAVSNASPAAFFDVYSNALGALPVVYRAARGTPASPTAVQANDILGGLAVRGYGATGWSTGRGQVMFRAAENWTDAANGTYLSMTTTPIGSTAWVERLHVDPFGYIGFGTSAPEFPIDARLNRGGTFARFGGTAQPLFLMGSNPQIGFNLFFDAGYRYGATWYGAYLAFNTDVSGGFSFGTAPLGGVNTVATVTPRMVITNDGYVGIGTTAPSSQLHVVSATTEAAGSFGSTVTNGTGVEGRANLGSSGWGVYGLAAEGTGVVGRSTSATGYGGRFENLGTGSAIGASVNSVEVMKADASGVHAGPGMTPTPIAHGYIDAAVGTRMSGSSNLACAWVQANLWYACTIAGQGFFYQDYTVSVTPTTAVIATTGSAGGQLLVQFFNLVGAAVKPSGGFSVVVYKQ